MTVDPAPRVASAETHQSLFSRFARAAAHWTGHPVGFGGAVTIVLLWAMSGPFFGFSDTWQLVINTGTTIITFLMVFVIQHTQNRDAMAMHLKLDEIIRSVSEAHNAFLDVEELEEGDLVSIRSRYEALARAAREDHDSDDHTSPATRRDGEGSEALRLRQVTGSPDGSSDGGR